MEKNVCNEFEKREENIKISYDFYIYLRSFHIRSRGIMRENFKQIMTKNQPNA